MSGYAYRAALCICMMVAMLSACSPTPPAPEGDVAAFERQLDALVPALLQRYAVPGASVAVVHGGEVVWAQGYGLADKTQGRTVTPDTIFQVASISKPVTVWGVMRLVETGKLELDAPVERYLTRWHLPPSEYDVNGVTIRRLLSHSAGLSLHGYPGHDPAQPLPSIEASLSGDNGGPVALTMPPGAQFSYSGGGYTLLQLTIEEVTGETFAAYMQRTVLGPLGMEHSAFEWTPATAAAAATGYGVDGQPQPAYIWTEKAAAGLYTTAPDLARWVAAAMPGPGSAPAGRGVLQPATLETMFAPAIAVTGAEATVGEDAYGLGYALEAKERGLMVSHGGSNQGWLTYFAALPGSGEGLVVLTNSDRSAPLTADVLTAWADWLRAGTTKTGRALSAVRTGGLVLLGLIGVAVLINLARIIRRARAPQVRPVGLREMLVGLGAPGILLAVWLYRLRAFADAFMPDIAAWLTIGLIVWLVLIVAGAALTHLPPRSATAG